MAMLVYVLICAWVVSGLVFSAAFIWRARKPLLLIASFIEVFACFGLFFNLVDVFSGLLAFSSLYVVFNVFRVFEQRMNEHYLKTACRRTGLALIAFQFLTGAAWLGWQHINSRPAAAHWALLVWVAATAVTGLIVLGATIKNIIRSRPKKISRDFVAKLPTLSVCIPARNETEDLQQCLETLVANDYPKLEVIVLDDCSQTRRTPEIIRGFAQSGVRFIAGTEPEPHWLAKNWAYEQLLNAANGELVLFCGVDTRFEPESLRRIVAELSAGKKNMLSLVPERLDREYFSLIQPMRYFWELAVPRYLFKRPPVLSTCWVASRQSFLKYGGFSAVSRKIVPEAYFARKFFNTGKYGFVRSLNVLGVSTRKPITEQRATALRTRYPQVHRRPEWVLALSLIEAAFLVAPFVFFIAGWFINDKLFLVLAAAACVAMVAAYEIMIISIISPSALFALVSFPFVVLADTFMLNFSMYKYEFSVVEWKNRNICIPAMHVYPKLPPVLENPSKV